MFILNFALNSDERENIYPFLYSKQSVISKTNPTQSKKINFLIEVGPANTNYFDFDLWQLLALNGPKLFCISISKCSKKLMGSYKPAPALSAVQILAGQKFIFSGSQSISLSSFQLMDAQSASK